MEWETIDGYHFRTKVPGGWLVKVIEDVFLFMDKDDNHPQTDFEWRVAIAFVPDINHEWEIKK